VPTSRLTSMQDWRSWSLSSSMDLTSPLSTSRVQDVSALMIVDPYQ
jgi:hypothetical protein